MIVCYQSCRSCKDMLIKSINSIKKYNKNVKFFIFNNKRSYWENDKKIDTEEMEYRKEDINEIAEKCGIRKSLIVVDISSLMFIFDDSPKLKNQTNTYMRLLMPFFLKRFGSNIDRFLYCDEDVLCSGDLTKLYNIDFINDFAGFRNTSINEKFIKFHPNRNHINNGILMMKTTFNIFDNIELINATNIASILNMRPLHDQFIVNLYGVDEMELPYYPISKDYMTNAHMRQIYSMKRYNIFHTDDFKNNEDIIKKVHGELIKQYGIE